jgi:hypothetical protein
MKHITGAEITVTLVINDPQGSHRQETVSSTRLNARCSQRLGWYLKTMETMAHEFDVAGRKDTPYDGDQMKCRIRSGGTRTPWATRNTVAITSRGNTSMI